MSKSRRENLEAQNAELSEWFFKGVEAYQHACDADECLTIPAEATMHRGAWLAGYAAQRDYAARGERSSIYKPTFPVRFSRRAVLDVVGALIDSESAQVAAYELVNEPRYLNNGRVNRQFFTMQSRASTLLPLWRFFAVVRTMGL